MLTQSLTEIMTSIWMTEFKQSIIDQSYRYCDHNYCNLAREPATYENLDFVAQLPTLPTEIMLQLDINCNLKCASCRPHRIYSPAVNEQAYAILIQLSKDYQQTIDPVTVFCDGVGDVFASAAYQKFLRSDAIPSCFRFVFTTNGNLITKNRKLLEQLKERINTVTISLDAATPKTYKKIRGGNFNTVLDGIRMLKSMGLTVNTEFVVQTENYSEILQYYELVESIGVDNVGLNLLDQWSHMTLNWWETNNIFSNQTTNYEFLKDALPKIKKTNPDFAWNLESRMKKIIPIISQ